jgi:ABC-type uncharacterized transport system involved in gliding motility auxiliary subunit
MLKTIVGIIGWVATLLIFAGLGIRTFRPEWDRYAYWLAIAGLVLMAIYILSQWREIVRSFERRETKFGAMTGVSVIALLAILIGVNYLAGRRDKRWDLTASQSFTLSDQSLQIINNLKAPVRILVFEKPTEVGRFRDALTGYEYVSKNQIQVEYIDPDRQPARVKEYGVANYGTVVLEHAGRRETVMSDREQDLTNALIKITTGRQIKAYFIEGHGEKNFIGNDRTGYANVVDLMKRDNYTVDKLALAQTTAVPDDASVIIVAGPAVDYLKPEVDAIDAYLRKGGKALFLLDPPVGEDARPIPVLEGLLKQWGITLGHDVVIDISGMGQLLGTDASVPVVVNYPSHPVTRDFRVLTAFPFSQSVSGQADTSLGPTASVQNMLQTSERSWSESDAKSLTAGGKVSLDEKAGDRKGPITIGLSLAMDAPDAPASAAGAASADKPAETAPTKPQMRVIVVGDSDFASNAASGVQGNADLFVNMNNWLTQQEDLISIHPRDSGDRRVTMTADQQRRVAWLSLLFIPGLILGSGVYAWWQRR